MIQEDIGKIYRVIFIIVLIGMAIILVRSIKLDCDKEGWVTYSQYPYGATATGKDDPLVFYNVPQYRLPYNWPFGFKTSYPVEHVAPILNTPWL
jgi:hypothetical protein